MHTETVATRKTKYCQAIEDCLDTMRHATNADLLEQLRKLFPDLSATTVHRATARLAERGTIAIAPPTNDGVMRYDSNITPHDHFQCSECGLLKDTDIKDQVSPLLESALGGCQISGRLLISGICNKCIKGECK